ncbi:carbohydrate ABC transporter permease [Phytoactinopolyspora halotolerans]|uniref:Carbohydrate ABC transporter permease n=1 Tax=Phytoactinopolyspora halotolerans TaxID=1981512 RepID=A0A6L9S289_9ACTN|nr:carbohydrate ABC transporter permease [Phytoactinopolyspora halotolerans]NED99564.1 carbohydrate ABC transporter permease [Phytoactinopolyspora halotolerans]
MTIPTTPDVASEPDADAPRARRPRRAESNKYSGGWFARRLPWWFAAALLLGGAFLWIYPFLWMVSASLKNQLEIFGAGLSLIPEAAEWENYSRAWNEANFSTYTWNTIIVTSVTVLLVVARCAMAGYVIGRYGFAGKKLVMVILIATFFVPTGYTIIPVVEISQQLGLLNSLTGMIIAMSGGGNVAAILLYAGYFRGIPKELEESAVVDGAGFFTIFFRIMLPLAMPITATVTLMTFLATWNNFFIPLVFSLSRPELRTLSVGMRAFVSENTTDWGGMAAAATISLIPLIILFVLLQRHFVKGFAGAIKQ